ncbi:MAG: hypothetical protein EHM12_08075 [Dehalococcoidia bacterium]|nr:MAG: hypothetical protein EHM12_08075 [Dehalococcoidia bacterium]
MENKITADAINMMIGDAVVTNEIAKQLSDLQAHGNEKLNYFGEILADVVCILVQSEGKTDIPKQKVSGLGLVAKLEPENENDLFDDTILITTKKEIKKRFKSVSFNGRNRIIWIKQSEIETIKQNVDFDDYVVSFALSNNYSINFDKR